MARVLKVAFCDDEEARRKKYRQMLDAVKTDHTLQICEYSNGSELVFDLADPSQHPDILYLDIHMPELDGVSAATQLRQKLHYRGAIVFLTVRRDQVFNAFDVDAVYFLVKDDFNQAKFAEVFDKACTYLEAHDQRRCAVFSCAGEDRVIPVEEIHWFEVKGHVAKVHFGIDDEFEFYSSMAALVEQLRDAGFVRVSRSCLVAVKDIASYTSKLVETKQGTVISVGHSYAPGLKEALQKLSIVSVGSER